MKHARLAPSAAHRWMECPGTIRLSESLDLPEEDPSEYALEGTEAHHLVYTSLTKDRRPDLYVGETLWVPNQTGTFYPLVIESDMAHAAATMFDYVRSREATGMQSRYETRVTLDGLTDTESIFGTSDVISWDDDLMEVVDYKHGTGVYVSEIRNPQLLIYAIGAMLTLGIYPHRIRTTIVQPRYEGHAPIRSWELTYDELRLFAGELIAAVRRVREPHPVFRPGTHCRFCPARAVCPALASHTRAVARTEFAPAPIEIEPTALSVAELSAVLHAAPYIKQWLDAVADHARSLLQSGGNVPGWKLVPGRASRQWADEEQAREWMRENAIEPEIAKVRSVAQAEKLVAVPDSMIVVTRGVQMAPDTDPRPALNARTEFATFTENA